MKNSTFENLLTAGNKTLQNIAALISIGGSGFAFVTASQDGSRLEILLGIGLGIIGQIISLISMMVGRYLDERIRSNLEKRYEALKFGLETAENNAQRLNYLLSPRTIAPEHHENFIKSAQSIERLNAAIKVVFDAGFDSASLAYEIADLFRVAGWQTKDGGSLLSYGAVRHGVCVCCLSSYRRSAEPIAELLRKSGVDDVFMEISRHEMPWEIAIYVFRAKNKLGSK